MSNAATASVGQPVDVAILEGRVPPAKREAYMRLYASDPAGAASLLLSLPVTVPLSAVGGSAPEGGETIQPPEAYPKSERRKRVVRAATSSVKTKRPFRVEWLRGR